MIDRIDENIYTIDGEIYRAIHAASLKNSKKHKSRQSKDRYIRGAKNTKSDPARIEREGKLGEALFCAIIDRPEYFTLSEDKAKTDFYYNDKKVDVKTSTYHEDVCLLRTDRGINSDYYVLFRILEDSREKSFAKLKLMGYFTAEDVRNSPILPSPKRDCYWSNYNVSYSVLKNLNELL